MAWLNEKKRVNKAIGKTGTYWALAWREDGKVRTRGLGFCTREEARRSLKVAEGKLAAGEQVAPTPTGDGSSAKDAAREVWTLGDYMEKVYLPVVQRDKAPGTHRAARDASRALTAVIGHVYLDRVDFALVDHYLSERKKLGRHSRTLILELWVLRGALVHAQACGVIAQVPRLPTVKDRDRKPHRYLTAEESERLLAAIRPPDSQPEVTRGRPPLQYDYLSYLAVLMALNTGMRKGEILSRRWEDVHWDRGPCGALVVCARPEISFRVKTGRERAVPLTPELREELDVARTRAGRPDRGWIFPSPGAVDLPRKDFKKALKAACARAGLPPIYPHALRHSWASRLAMAGVDRKALMEIGGWADGKMLDQVYAHVTDAHVAEVMVNAGIAPRPARDARGVVSLSARRRVRARRSEQ
jgi:integrase